MEHAWVYRFCLAVALFILLAIVTGAAVTNLGMIPEQERTDSRGGLLFPGDHEIAGALAGVLAVVLTIWLPFQDKRTWLARLGGLAIVAGLADSVMGTRRLTRLLPLAAGFSHALLAPVFFSLIAAIAVFLAPSWPRSYESVQDYGWPSMRSLAAAAPVLVLIQIALGAGYRHSLLGVLPHVLGALAVALFLVIVCAFALHQFPKHGAIRSASRALLGVTATQVFLGMAALIMRLLAPPTSPWLTLLSLAHVGTGSLTLAASVALAIQVRRNVRPRASEPSPA
jgi:heme A synthase